MSTPIIHLPLEDLLREIRFARWTLHIFGPKDSPDLYCASRHWENRSDVFILRSEQEATAFRVPMFPDTDLFNPRMVEWQYHGSPIWTLRAVLTLPAPSHPQAPSVLHEAHPLCVVPEEIRHGVRGRTSRRSGLNQPPNWSWL